MITTEVFAHFSGSNFEFYRRGIWQDSARQYENTRGLDFETPRGLLLRQDIPERGVRNCSGVLAVGRRSGCELAAVTVGVE